MSNSDNHPKRKLGASAIEMTPVGLGCMSFSGVYGPSDDDAAIELIHYAIDNGVDALDSSDMYGWGHNEQLLGRALAGRRDKIVLISKFGQVKNPDGGGKARQNLVNKTVCASAQTSLCADPTAAFCVSCAVANPIPELPPITNTFLPCRLMVCPPDENILLAPIKYALGPPKPADEQIHPSRAARPCTLNCFIKWGATAVGIIE